MKVPTWLLLVPLALQALAMLVDEVHFHRKRGLGPWERIGHPLDTMTVVACLAFLVLVPPTPRALAGFVALAAFSCVFVTKDEGVHARRCGAGEHWLHALLFVLHPISLASLALLWHGVADDAALAARILPGQLLMTCAFCAYQTLYWNLPWTRRTPTT